eukprot:01598.XXX_3514_877_1 [CDS] Oithona nana genome sequencing.
MNGPPTSLSSVTFSRKMRKNFAGVVLLIMAGILICLALSNLVLMEEEDQYQKSEKSDSGIITFRSLKGNRKIMNPQSSDAYSVDSNFYPQWLRYMPEYRVVHLDFKGATPNISYLKEIFPLLKKSGANTLLIEYEDTFPYWGKIVNASALNAFTVKQIQELLNAAKVHQLEVIPLVQTFGHMEHVLKLEEFQSLREVPNNPISICPTKDEAFPLVKEMIDQLMNLHQGHIKFLHIGCDEVFQLGLCSRCKSRLKQDNLRVKDLFVDHVSKVAQYVRTQYHVQPIIWDDMLRTMTSRELQESALGHFVEPMVWVYVEDIDHFIDGSTWASYSANFEYIWAASAFKGAFGERLFMPNILRHYRNNLAWLDIMERESNSYGHGKAAHFRGLTLTGWSRYDHFAVLCELLPVALPSLILNLEIISNNATGSSKFRQAEKLLKCPTNDRNYDRFSALSLEQDPHQFDLRRCRFPGWKIFGAVGSLNRYKAEVEALITKSRETQGWLTNYNIRHNYSSPWRLSEVLNGHQELSKSLAQYKEKTSKTLSSVFEKTTVRNYLR